MGAKLVYVPSLYLKIIVFDKKNWGHSDWIDDWFDDPIIFPLTTPGSPAAWYPRYSIKPIPERQPVLHKMYSENIGAGLAIRACNDPFYPIFF